jgi:hypothetical protein
LTKEAIFAFELNPCKMRILLLGSGGRDMRRPGNKSKRWANPLYIAPGKSWYSTMRKNVSLDIRDFDAIKNSVLMKRSKW